MENQRIIFQHIPKTAGTSIASLLKKQFSEEHSFICGKDGVLNDFIALNQKDRNSIKLMIGHVDFGIHDYFDDASSYITFLREPVDRVLSHYYFIRSHRKHRYHQYACRNDIQSFIKSGIRPRMNNCMTRMISGISPDYHCCSEEMLFLAKENIKSHYLFVGFLANIKESLNDFNRLMGWKTCHLPVLNVTPGRPAKEVASAETIGLITEYNQLDIRLYDDLALRTL
jgi:hypothetical protein